MENYLSLGIIIDEKCNIQCEHCCFSSGPNSTMHLDDSTILSIVDEAMQIDQITAVGLSGGEAMLRKDLVLEVVRRVSNAGKKATLTSNGFWGVTDKKAERLVKELLCAGLSFLTISYDDFHSDLLSSVRVSNVLDACRKLNLDCAINVAVTRSKNAENAIGKLGTSASQGKLRFFPVTPVGAAKQFNEADFVRTAEDPKPLKCPGFEPTFHFDGNIYPCCSPSVFETELVIGKIGENTVKEAMRNISHNAYFSVIRNEGFGWLCEKAAEYGLIKNPGEVTVVDVCELCSSIASDAKFLRSIAPALIGRASDLYSRAEQTLC